MCAESCGIGILIHEMPFISGHGGHTINWPISLLDKLADIPNIIAIKEDAKNDDYSHEVIRTIKDRLSIIISGGGKRQWLQFADQGCQAWLNGIGVFEPKLAILFWKHTKIMTNICGKKLFIRWRSHSLKMAYPVMVGI